MSDPRRPILKLKIGKGNGANLPSVPQSATAQTPSGMKLKLKFRSQDSTAPETPSIGTQKPKIIFKKPKKLAGQVHERDEGEVPLKAGPKRLKITNKKTSSVHKTPITPHLRLKTKGKAPKRPPGIGYDSEASDTEIDPHIEEEFILRMQPGEDCDYVREAIENKTLGKRVSEGGADIKLKFLRQDGRRATLTVRGKIYAASMVDLPCIIEGMKSWDKKSFWKTADISQMLLVLGPVAKEEDALVQPLPKGDVREGTWQYEHGLTPPMKWVMRRRFRKRVSTNIVVQVEQAVEDLFRRDAEAITSDYKLQTVEEAAEERAREEEEERRRQEEEELDYFGDGGEGEEGEEGEEDDSRPQNGSDLGDWDEMMRDSEAEEEASESQAATPSALIEPESGANTPVTVPVVAETPDSTETPAAQDDDGEESGSDADEDDADEEEDEEQQEDKRHRDEIAELESVIKTKKEELQNMTNLMFRRRGEKQLQELQQNLATKKAAIGEADDDD